MTTRVDLSKLTLMDALDLASLIEVEACKRYELFASQIGHRDPTDAAAFFRSMAINEKKHGDQLAERRRALFGDAPAKVKLEDVFEIEAPDVGSAAWDMSTLKALKVALSSEQKAYDFYDEALPGVTQPDVRALFVELRDEEAEHIEMVEALIDKSPPEAAIDLHDADVN